MFERPDVGERAVIVHIEFSSSQSESEDLGEFIELVRSAGVETVDTVTGSRNQPSSRLFVGQGKLDEIRAAREAAEADVVLFNHALSPSQERNLERELKCRVLDRTGVILDIFAQRARTHEGKLQVELAQLDHMATRLIRGWTHLERQKGGIGMRGPGETQLETDRRLLRARIKSIHRRLEKVRRQRDQGRRARKRADIPTVSLVGYTNAGKSTLFNHVTTASVYAADQLFATLDPTLRRLDLPDIGPVVMADTVGFIRHLPHKLVEAFRATLEETTEASLLLHIIDCADERRDENIEQVEDVLLEIGADEVPMLQVYNKVDLLEDFQSRVDRNDEGVPVRVWVSAITGEGIPQLFDAIVERLAEDVIHLDVLLGPQDGKLRALLHEAGAVIGEEYRDDGDTVVEVRLQSRDWYQILSKAKMQAENIRFADNS
ncbi:MAG: GTPase HflX [Alteromonadaceae bacterium]|uniref:ribosome rescue GTPase HflX n=1 Tax=Marinobacter sp. BGYM27 TaxID=2975597 RepID=UPI000C5919A0|nr:ribosome rescue GTPase HflX [Marinobacter sp. BGYM27]MAA66057.1 GTPase HflX [Alteromonadaceae bacterium]MBH86313.1 GTPase HflX [Alteromonadaceae bacterium]MDG5499312.1 GTPase HflX [Marinobacter sp. BGYM27]